MITTGGGTDSGADGRGDDGLASFGNAQLVALYQELRRRGVSSLPEAAGALGLSPEEHERCRAELIALGLVVPTTRTHATISDVRDASWRPDADTVAAVDPEIAMLRLLDRERARLREHLEEADQAYGTLETLAATYLRASVLTGSEVEVEALTDYRRIQQALDDIIDVMQESSASMYPGGPSREVHEVTLDRDRRRLGQGIRVRAIYAHEHATRPDVAELLEARSELGVEVRVAGSVPLNMIIIDQQYALLPIRPEDARKGAILARGRALVRSYLGLFEHCWHTAVPYGTGAASERGGDGLSEQQRAALQMLATGMKDEKIARNLGVSLRTVSRMLSELMQELGATSRFEAGVRAVRMGWLD
ncbi:LuxR C-terminal-related transcriptional regulator [Streptomyces sp. NPDC090025]|uniref:LuxR C-terminal-related transcriptional regulator n=1 Tax=Streptomyces sp. NPDC090025 TaxID=3365922 RepID=UPI0038366428